ncbi:hypothetical protein FSZ31_07870 [Sphingorhabdus soli]|uniref:Uncharacterized protein n=1 Tax=Flavisphingopyxis soli TaxID=2601267 RepID=A0A5C6U773_9SPHN|nr:hypothetical protein [Sphingorhabdus soli]TXC68873.1 hypothetical protein FSZ31_07870 [Sphingorhabdus soli]
MTDDWHQARAAAFLFRHPGGIMSRSLVIILLLLVLLVGGLFFFASRNGEQPVSRIETPVQAAPAK